ncbi:MAG: hypothetical protein L0H96_19835, partial [Humibacillus sp.]|nr:hypothetical protein [Humibacillus sp.]
MPLAPPTSTRRPSTAEPAPEIERALEPTAPEPFSLSGVQVAGSALAAATSAFAASTLGVAGTVFGALIGSLVLTLASAIYSHSLRRVGRQLRVTGPTALTAATAPQPRSGRNPDRTDHDRPRPPVKRPRLPWRRIIVGVVVGAALALGAITALEKVIGHPVSGPGSSGTSIGEVVRGNVAPPATDRNGPNAPENKNSDRDAPAPSPDSPSAPVDQQPTTEPAPQDGQQPPTDQ